MSTTHYARFQDSDGGGDIELVMEADASDGPALTIAVQRFDSGDDLATLSISDPEKAQEFFDAVSALRRDWRTITG